MKHTAIVIIILMSILSCKAQQPIVPLGPGNEYGHTNGAYYKDVNNDFNILIGTWKYTNGNKIFEVTFRKKDAYLMNIDFTPPVTFYEDILYGEYKYVDENGSVQINTLDQIEDSSLDIYEHLIQGNSFVTKYYPPACDACAENERRIKLSFTDPEREYLMSVILVRHIISPFVDQNGDPIETIELELTDGNNGIVVLPEEDSPRENRVPYGKYTLIKQ